MEKSVFALKDANTAIIGLGLMGGSLALSLKENCRRLSALDTHPPTLELARRQGIVHVADNDPVRVLADADLVLLACPVPAILDWLRKLPEYVQHPCIVLDIGSSKRTILAELENLPPNFDPIGGHPICGRERLSLENAERFLYQKAPFVLVPMSRTSEGARSAAVQIVTALGAVPTWMNAEQHDRILASTSHLPYLLSSALVLATPEDTAALAGPGFRSSTRLAGTPSSMMLGVLLSNADNVLTSLAGIRRALDTLESALKNGDRKALEAALSESQRKYHSIFARPTLPMNER
jgi:prephenate dehydrogenase